MISVENDRSIFIEVLFLHPPDEFTHLSAGTGHGICVLISLEIIPAESAFVSILKMCIHREHGKIEGFILLSHLLELVFGIGKQFLVFKAPEHIVIFGDESLFYSPFVITDLKIAVFGQIQSPAAEGGIGPHHKSLIVSLFVQNVPQGGYTGEKGILRVHFIEGSAFIRELFPQIDLERKSGRLCKHTGHCIGGSRHYMAAVQKVCAAVEIFPLHRQLGELRDHILREGSSLFRIRKGHLHGFQIDIDQVPLLFRERHSCLFGVYIIIFNKGRVLHLVDGKTDQVELDDADPKREYKGDQGSYDGSLHEDAACL